MTHGAFSTRRILGFTLIEFVIVIILIGIVSALVLPRGLSASRNTAGFQASRLANDLRHAQMLATTWNKALVFTATPTGYSVTCAVASGGPCTSTSTPVSDPGRTDSNFSVALTDDVTLSGSTTITYDIVGKPSAAATFNVLASGAQVNTVTVAANSGYVAVQ